ncbi:alpha/beta fold hydrolase [Paludibacter sp. 221]|uniref:alpha/beta fold hydrolase n=1 Tax=Paludibacter sp. 221 TaxID=2302939 RepID=UPI0013D39098|nr:alpha/beta hydrolase [Paludibacter sp. 221]
MTEEAYVHLNGHSLFVKKINNCPDANEKPVLIFLHDSWGCTEMWEDFPEKLVKLSGLNGLVYDRQGYGKSSPFNITARTNNYLHDEAHELIDLLNLCGIKNAVLYGHSDGASIALIAAALYSDRIKGLLLEGAHSFVEESGKNAVRQSRERAKHSSLIKSLEKFHGDKAPELFRLWHETWLNDGFVTWTIVPLLKDIACPVLAFQGESDEFGTIKQLSVLEKEIPSPTIITEIPKAAHTPRKEAAEETLKWIESYFSQNQFF